MVYDNVACDKAVCVCEKGVWQRWCVTKMCVKDGECERWCVTKMCVTKLCVCGRCYVLKMVCGEEVCGRWCVTKLCVKDRV